MRGKPGIVKVLLSSALLAAALTGGSQLSVADLQAQSVEVGSGSGPAGGSIDVNLGFKAGSTPVASLQVDLSFSSDLTMTSVTAGEAASAAGKSALGSRISGGMRVLIYGVNQNTIGSGVLAKIRLGSSSSATPRTIPLLVAGVTASDPNGKAVACSSTGGSITLLERTDTTPPEITGVSATGITDSSAIIKWTTDEPADSQVEYGLSAAYGSLSPSQPTLTTSHSVTLQNLSAFTAYHFRVRSTDADSNIAFSADYTFNTNMALTLYYPRLLSTGIAPAIQDNRMITGVGLSNADTKPATLRFTAFDAAGSMLGGTSIVNPATRVLGPGKQMPFLDSDLFGAGISSQSSPGWIMVESSSAGVAGFFLMFNSSLTALDGAPASSSLLNSFVFPEVESGGFNVIHVANPNPEPAALKMDLVKSDGTIRGSFQSILKPGAALVGELSTDLFRGDALSSSDYVRVTSERGLSSYQSLGRPGADIEGMNGQDTKSGAKTLFCPQYVAGGGWQTRLSIVNLDDSAGTVALRLIGDNGVQIGEKQLPMAASGKIRIDDPAFFVPAGPSAPLTQGYLEISSTALRLTGSVVFGGSGSNPFAAALPLVSRLQSSLLFSQVSSNAVYFSGVAILNPNSSDALATIDVLNSEGQVEFRSLVSIPARQRRARLLTEYFPFMEGFSRNSGYIRITVDRPAASFALFGTSSLQVLSAIPPQ